MACNLPHEAGKETPMTGRITDHGNVDLTALNLDVITGRGAGRILWQPRIIAWYHDKVFAGQPLPEPYAGMTLPQLYRSLGVSNRIYDFGCCYQSHEDQRVRITQRELSKTDYEVLVETPVGVQRAIYRRSPNSPWHMPVKWPIGDPDEMKVAAWREERRTWSWDQAAYDGLCATWEGLGAPTMFILRTNVQKLFVEDMGVEEAVFALHDYPFACQRYFEALAVTQERQIEIINASPIRYINFGDNVHGRLCTPELFRAYMLPVYQRRCELLHRAGKFVHAHWDGDCGPLLPLARETGLDGIEAITPVPQGDVTLEEVKSALGEMFLIDGIPAIYFDRTFSEQTLVDCAKRIIDLFAPNLILGVSDEVSSTGNIERIRLVTRVVDDYNASL